MDTNQIRTTPKIWGILSQAGLLVALTAGPLHCQPPQIWFGPLDDFSRQSSVNAGRFPISDGGPTDYMNLFAPGALWPQAASHVSVFKLYIQPFGSFSDAQFQQIFSFLKQNNIALAVEFGPLTPSGGCGVMSGDVAVEGFNGQTARLIVDRITANGGTLNYVAMDEPFYYGSIYGGPGACNWSAQQIATNALASLNILKAAFPGLVTGDIEPVPGYPAIDWVHQYASWMDAFQAAMGSKLAFFDSDVGPSFPWMSDITSLRAETSQRGILFGIIYDGLESDSSDEQWINHAEGFFTEFELSYAPPDQAIFQSWMPYPRDCLPETTPYTFTWLIDQYTRPRPSLSLSVDSSQAAGKLLDDDGNGIAAMSISVNMQPTTGPGIVATYTLTGTVPATINDAVIQICVNMCGTQGTNNMSVYSFSYTDSGDHAAFDFSNGLANWEVDQRGTAPVQLGADAIGPFLGISANADQSTYVNSASVFAVTPGSAFTLTVTARVSPDSTASGYFALIFLDGPGCPINCPLTSAYMEVSRDKLDYAPGTATLGTVQTSSDGSYSLPFVPTNTNGSFQVIAYYAGSDLFWPAQTTMPPGLTPSISANGIVNGADFKVEALSPGAWFSVTGQNLGNAAHWSSPNAFTLGGAAISVCEIPAVLSYNSGPIVANGTVVWQLNALMPDGVAGQTSCPVVVTVNGLASQPANVSIKAGLMELFVFTPSSGKTLPMVTHSDYSLVGPTSAGFSPAKPGEELIAWGTGDCSLPVVNVGNTSVDVSFSGQVAPGLCQLNFSVPHGLSGTNSLQVSTSPGSYILSVAP